MSNLNDYVACLASSDEAERAYAAEDLGYLNLPEAVAPLVERLPVEPSAVVRDAIFQALVRIEGDAAIAGAIGLLTSDHSQMRNLAVTLLNRKGNRAIPFLKRAMQEGDRDTRKFVLDALSGMPASGIEDIYAAALTDHDTNVVITAVENLGNLRATAFRSQIENLIQEDAHPMLLAACLEALAGIGNDSSLAVIQRCFPQLAELPAFSLIPCLKAIGALGGEKEFEQVLGLLPARAPQFNPAILGALIQLYERGAKRCCPVSPPSDAVLAALRALIESSDEPALCRYQAARVLGFWSDREDVSASLLACLSNLEKMVRLGAAEALKISNRPEFCTVLAAYEADETGREVNQPLNR